MGRIIYLPFEELPQRYTAMWNFAIRQNLTADDIIVDVDNSEHVIRNGEFLDTFGTIAYKQSQIERIANLFQKNVIKDNDVFFVPDIFYPGLESIRYMAELSGIKVKIVAFNHAGRADKYDFVQNLGKWADIQEAAWHKMCDVVLVGSKHQKENVEKKFGKKNVIVTGAVWDKKWMDNNCGSIDKREKEDFVIYPHRICKEKGFELFIKAANANPNLQFVITSCGNKKEIKSTLPANVTYQCNLSKHEYYKIFAKAKYYLSTAYQETFGYTIQEAIYFGCNIIVPKFACYSEYVSSKCLVEHKDMCKRNFLTEMYLENNLRESVQFNDNAEKICTIIRNL